MPSKKKRKTQYERPQIHSVSEAELFANLGQSSPYANPAYGYYAPEDFEPTLPPYRIPLCTIHDAGDSFVLRVELPGAAEEQIDLQVGSYDVMIAAEPKPEAAAQYGSTDAYHGTLALPEEVVPEKTKYEYKNGVMRVTLAKKQAPPRKRVKVAASAKRKKK